MVWCNAYTFCAIAWFRPEMDLARGGTSKRVKERPGLCSHISMRPANISASSEMPIDSQKFDSTPALQVSELAWRTARLTHELHTTDSSVFQLVSSACFARLCCLTTDIRKLNDRLSRSGRHMVWSDTHGRSRPSPDALRFKQLLATTHPGTLPSALFNCNACVAPPSYTSQQKPVDLAICIGARIRQSDLEIKNHSCRLACPRTSSITVSCMICDFGPHHHGVAVGIPAVNVASDRRWACQRGASA